MSRHLSNRGIMLRLTGLMLALLDGKIAALTVFRVLDSDQWLYDRVTDVGSGLGFLTVESMICLTPSGRSRAETLAAKL